MRERKILAMGMYGKHFRPPFRIDGDRK
jgi:hypothetical protein